MSEQRMHRFRGRLQAMADKVERSAESLEEDARTGTSEAGAGNLSNTPMHLGDLGTEVYLQELSGTLLENEVYLQNEIHAALRRMDQGTYGQCERCGREVPEGRLEALPYARHCVACSEAVGAGATINFNTGRPGAINPPDLNPGDDSHAAGTAGGGTAVGGLAGVNVGRGDPVNADLEAAMGSGSFDNAIEQDQGEEGYSGPTGGAVGGAMAGARASGGKTGGGLRPGPGVGDSPTGQ